MSKSAVSIVGTIFSVIIFGIFFLVGTIALAIAGLEYSEGGASLDLLPFLIGGVAFVLMPVFKIGRAFWKDTEVPPLPEEAPWEVRPAWQTNELTENTSLEWSRILFGAFWNLLTWLAAGFALYYGIWQASEPEWGALFTLIFPAAGLFLGWPALKEILHHRKFGASTLVMDTMPGRLGDRLRARLRSRVSPEDAPDDGFYVRLSCYRRYITHDSDGDRNVKRDLKWRDEKHMRGRRYAGTEWETEVPISFELPTEPPPSTPRKKKERILWELEVTAEIEGLDYEAAFELPVFEPDETTAPAQEATEGPIRNEASRDSEEEVFWGMGEDDTVESEIQQEQPAGSADPYVKHEVGDDFTEPVSDGIRMEGRPGRGLTFSFAPTRSKGQALLLSVLGVVLLGAGWLLLPGSVLFGLVFLLIGGVVTYGAWQKWTRACTLTVENGQIEVQAGAFGTGSPERLPCMDLEDVRVEAEGHGGSTTYYTLKLVPATSEAHGGGKKAAQVLEWIQGDGTGNTEQEEGTTSQIRETLEKHSKTIRVAGNLTNKQEADWIAKQILEAADREASFHSSS